MPPPGVAFFLIQGCINTIVHGCTTIVYPALRSISLPAEAKHNNCIPSPPVDITASRSQAPVNITASRSQAPVNITASRSQAPVDITACRSQAQQLYTQPSGQYHCIPKPSTTIVYPALRSISLPPEAKHNNCIPSPPVDITLFQSQAQQLYTQPSGRYHCLPKPGTTIVYPALRSISHYFKAKHNNCIPSAVG